MPAEPSKEKLIQIAYFTGGLRNGKLHPEAPIPQIEIFTVCLYTVFSIEPAVWIAVIVAIIFVHP